MKYTEKERLAVMKAREVIDSSGLNHFDIFVPEALVDIINSLMKDPGNEILIEAAKQAMSRKRDKE